MEKLIETVPSATQRFRFGPTGSRSAHQGNVAHRLVPTLSVGSKPIFGKFKNVYTGGEIEIKYQLGEMTLMYRRRSKSGYLKACVVLVRS